MAKDSVSKTPVSKPNLTWSEIAAIVFVIEHLKDRKMTKLGLNPTKLIVIRRAQSKMTLALENYIENGK